jgi:hypothetical protein
VGDNPTEKPSASKIEIRQKPAERGVAQKELKDQHVSSPPGLIYSHQGQKKTAWGI